MLLTDFKLFDEESKNYYKEIWEDHEYERFGINIESGDIVVDCGANIGLFSQYALSKGASHVYAIESETNLYEEYLKENTKNTDKITLLHGFCSHSDEKGHYNLEKIFKTFNLDHIDFMKVDIEGWEFPLTLAADEHYFNLVKKWAIELHFFGMEDKEMGNFPAAFALLEKFSANNYKICIQQTHINTCLYMLYAIKQ